MRAALVLAVLAGRTRAEPEAELHEQTATEGVSAGIGTAMRMRTDGAAVGVGVASRFVHGDYALSLGLTRWQTIEDVSQGSWELALRGYRLLRLGEHTHAYVMAGTSVERVERGDASFTRARAMVGVGVSWQVTKGLVGWAQLSLDHKRWLEKPPDVRERDELQLMLMFGLSF